jgi:hypothetical protein
MFRGRGRFSRKAQRNETIAASELARLGYCEAKVFFDARHGERPTAAQCARRAEGLAAHAQFHTDGQLVQREPAQDKRCFVATLAFGSEAYETQALRDFRDDVLLRTRWGRALVRLYYVMSPNLCAVLPRLPGATKVVRWVLRILLASLSKA